VRKGRSPSVIVMVWRDALVRASPAEPLPAGRSGADVPPAPLPTPPADD